MAHSDLTEEHLHTPYRWIRDTFASLPADPSVDDVNKKALTQDTWLEYLLTSVSPVTWQLLGQVPQSNYSAVVAPAVTDDDSEGYTVGSRWVDTVTGKEYVLVDATEGAAVWVETTGAGGGGAGIEIDITVGAQVGNNITLDLQASVADQIAFFCWISDTNSVGFNGVYGAPPDGGSSINIDGQILFEPFDDRMWYILTNGAGFADLVISHSGTQNWYLNVTQPDGTVVISSVIAFV